ncbi:MAG: histidinol-phosphate transaminase [Candidatus Omnitrophica bacterium]|nr:histidinol-phosphate transaminase [Candidatus Omnitrophota bacterium]MCM8802127.1 histidinol-phosphate transaminase [Candidatus Omnitrophota bacterium]
MGDNIDKLVRKEIKEIAPYVPGKPIDDVKRLYNLKRIIKLASNENPLGYSQKVKEALRENLDNINRYPDGSGYYLKKELSNFLNIPEDEIILGSGSSEVISLAIETFVNPGEEVIYPFPSFIIYRILVLKVGGVPVEVPLEENFSYNLNKFFERITSKTKVIILCNPNNPTGTIVYKEQLEKFLSKIPDNIIIISDEAYFEYVENKNFGTCFPYYKDKNIVLTRSFSKIYGLASLRIGYGIGKSEILNYMERIRPPFNTTGLAQIAAITALNDQDFVKKSINVNKEGKRFLYGSFEKLGIEYIPTEANFILCKFKQDATDIVKELEKRGIIIRGMKSFNLSNQYVRITIGTEEENKLLIKELSEIIKYQK